MAVVMPVADQHRRCRWGQLKRRTPGGSNLSRRCGGAELVARDPLVVRSSATPSFGGGSCACSWSGDCQATVVCIVGADHRECERRSSRGRRSSGGGSGTVAISYSPSIPPRRRASASLAGYPLSTQPIPPRRRAFSLAGGEPFYAVVKNCGAAGAICGAKVSSAQCFRWFAAESWRDVERFSCWSRLSLFGLSIRLSWHGLLVVLVCFMDTAEEISPHSRHQIRVTQLISYSSSNYLHLHAPTHTHPPYRSYPADGASKLLIGTPGTPLPALTGRQTVGTGWNSIHGKHRISERGMLLSDRAGPLTFRCSDFLPVHLAAQIAHAEP